MTFTRALPKNLLEISQIVANLWGKVSRKTLLSQVPFVEDVDEELKAFGNRGRRESEAAAGSVWHAGITHHQNRIRMIRKK